MPRNSGKKIVRMWLKRILHAQFDDIVQEPIPEELLRILAGRRNGEDTKPPPDDQA